MLPDPNISGWTDDYSDLMRAILRRKLGHDAVPAPEVAVRR